MHSKDNKFPFAAEILGRFQKWTGLNDADISEALKDLTGDTYFEMRKLISLLLSEIENMIDSGLYCGYVGGKKLTEEEKKRIKEVREDHKESVRTTVESTWRAILNKQKIGIDKLSLSLKPYINGKETEISSNSEDEV